jgi:hypothetical protein
MRVYPRTPAVELVMRRVIKAPSGCWIITGHSTENGYGEVCAILTPGERPTTLRAHRVTYEAFVGPIPEGLVIDHLCRRRRCVNPLHLQAVLPLENWRRGSCVTRRNASKTRCIHGHPFTPENTMADSRGRRKCRACYDAYNKRRRDDRVTKGPERTSCSDCGKTTWSEVGVCRACQKASASRFVKAGAR